MVGTKLGTVETPRDDIEGNYSGRLLRDVAVYRRPKRQARWRRLGRMLALVYDEDWGFETESGEGSIESGEARCPVICWM